MNGFRLTACLLCLPLCLCFADTNGEKETQKILEKTISQGIDILKDSSLDDEGKLAKFDVLLTESCHLDLMAMLSLGKKNWMKFTKEERPKFITGYANLIKRSYYSKLGQQKMDKITTEYIKNEAISKTKRSLEAVIKNGTTQLDVIYKFAFRKDKWAIYDIEIEGISMVVSYRSQFNDFLAKHTPAELLTEITNGNCAFKAAGDDKIETLPGN